MDNERVDQIIDKYQGKASSVIQVLMEIQSENHWLPRGILERVSSKCTGSSCHIRGSKRLIEAVQGLTGIRPGETSADSRFSLETGNCLGCCSLGPEIVVDGKHHSKIAPDNVGDVLKDYD
jgi:NADH-quinone oxidoreductase subunit E